MDKRGKNMKIIQESYEAIKMIKFLSTFPKEVIVPAKEIAMRKIFH